MVNQLMVLSPSGPCFVHRTYRETKGDLDPQLIAAMIALGYSGNVKMSEIKQILLKESDGKKNLNIEVSNTHNYISCAISSNRAELKKLREILPKVNQLAYETLGNPKDLVSFENQRIDKTENRIDILMIKEGFLDRM